MAGPSRGPFIYALVSLLPVNGSTHSLRLNCCLLYTSRCVEETGLITGEVHFGLFTVVAVVVLAAFIYLMVRPNKYADNNEVKLDTSRI